MLDKFHQNKQLQWQERKMARNKTTEFLPAFGAFLEVLLIRFMKNNALPREWGANDSWRFSAALFCCHVAWCPSIVDDPSNPGVKIFSELYASAPDFTLRLMTFVRKRMKPSDLSIVDRVVLFLRCGVVDTRQEPKNSEFAEDVQRNFEKALAKREITFDAIKRVVEQGIRNKTDGEIAQALTDALRTEVSPELVRTARQRMTKEDAERRRSFNELSSKLQDYEEWWAQVKVLLKKIEKQ